MSSIFCRSTTLETSDFETSMIGAVAVTVSSSSRVEGFRVKLIVSRAPTLKTMPVFFWAPKPASFTSTS